jgi:hypothetical protein
LRDLFGAQFDDGGGPGVRLCRIDHPAQMLPRVSPLELCSRDDAYRAIWQLEEAVSAGVFTESIAPIVEWSARMYQLLPASQFGHHNYPGGLFIHVLQGSFWAVSLWNPRHSSVMPGLTPREAKAAWQVANCVAFAAHDFGKLVCDFAVLHRSDASSTPLTEQALSQAQSKQRFSPLQGQTTFDWMVQHDHADCYVQWIPREQRRPHDELTAGAVSRILADCGLSHRLPRDVLSVLSTPPPAAPPAAGTAARGDLHSAFWSNQNDADRRSAAYDASVQVAARDNLLKEWFAMNVRTGRYSVANGVFSPSGPNLLLDLGRLDPTDVRACLQHVQLGKSLASNDPDPVRALADHMFGARMLVVGVDGVRFVPGSRSVVMLTAEESAPLIAALEAAGIRASASPVDLARTVGPPMASVVPAASADSAPPTVSPAAVAVDLSSHAIAIPGTSGAGPADSRPATIAPEGSPVQRFLDHVALQPVALLTSSALDDELARLSDGSRRIEVATHPDSSQPIVYVSARCLRGFAQHIGLANSEMYAAIKAHPAVYLKTLQKAKSRPLWLALAPEASKWILDRAIVIQTSPPPPPMDENVEITAYALREWQNHLIGGRREYKPHRDAASSIVFSAPLLTALRRAHGRPTFNVDSRRLLDHFRACGIDGVLRDDTLVLAITDVPKEFLGGTHAGRE